MTSESSSTGERSTRFLESFEQAAIGMAHVDLEGRWLDANRHLCEIFGYAREELTTLTFRDLTHPDDLKADLECVRRVLSGNIRAYSLQKRYLRRDGTPVWTHLTSSLVRDNAGTPRYFIKIVCMLPDRPSTGLHDRGGLLLDDGGLLTTSASAAPCNLELSRPWSNANVAPYPTALEDFAHDLNNLLFVVLTYAELAMSDLSKASPLGQDLAEIQRAALRANDLTRHLVRRSGRGA